MYEFGKADAITEYRDVDVLTLVPAKQLIAHISADHIRLDPCLIGYSANGKE
jgi:hypothetical protein